MANQLDKAAEKLEWQKIADDARASEERSRRRGRDPYRGLVQEALPTADTEERRALGEDRPTLGMIAAEAFYREVHWGVVTVHMTPETRARWEAAADAVMFEIMRRVDPGTPAPAESGEEAGR